MCAAYQVNARELSSIDFRSMIGGECVFGTCGLCGGLDLVLVARFSLVAFARVVRMCAPTGPLMAAVNAQAQAALTTLNFVKSVGFDDNGDAIYVEFVFNRTNATTGSVEENRIEVPILTILPVPYLRVSAGSRASVTACAGWCLMCDGGVV
jgi:hypothetical protein